MTSTSTTELDLTPFLTEEGFVRRLAKSLLFDDHQVDDVVQQTWLAALRHPPREGGASRSWLATVVRHQASNLRRETQRRSARERRAADSESTSVASPADELLAREAQRREIVEVVAGLTEPYRSAILLRYFEGLPPRRIAVQLGVPKATVATRLKRGLALLREALDRRHDGDRRQWCMSLLPLAVPRGAVGVLGSKLTLWIGVLLTMKGVLLGTFGAGLLAWLGVGLWGDEAPRPHEVTAASAGDVEAPVLDPTDDGPAATVTDGARERAAPVASEPKRTGVPASVREALAGFRGQLVDPDGRPVADATVRLFSVDPDRVLGGVGDLLSSEPAPRVGPAHADATTDEHGFFALEEVWPGTMHALYAGVDTDHATLELLRKSPAPGQVVDLGVIRQDRQGIVEGVVVDSESGEPIVGAAVWAADFPGALIGVAPIDRLQPDSAVLLGLPSVEATTLADSSAYHEALRSHLGKNVIQADDDATFVLVDLPNWMRTALETLPCPRATTDAEGRFVLRGVVPGGNAMIVRAAGYANGSRPRVAVRSGATRNAGTIRLRRGEAVGGRVVDGAGAPLVGARVRVAHRPRAGLTGVLFADPPMTTDGSGEFATVGLPRGDVYVAIQPRAGDRWVVQGPFEAGDDTLELAVGARVQRVFTVTSPLELTADDLRVRLLVGPPLGELATVGGQVDVALDGERLRRGAADGGGVRLELGGLLPGIYTLLVGADDHVTTARSFAVEATGAVDAEGAEAAIALDPAVAVDVLVVDERGTPVHGAEVVAQSAKTPGWAGSLLWRYGGIESWNSIASPVGATDEQGRVTVQSLPAGGASLLVSHPAYGAVVADVELRGGTESNDSTVRVELGTPGSIDGRLFDNGTPASPEKWRILAVFEDASWTETRTQAPLRSFQTRLDDGGRFRLDGLAPGRYRIDVEPAEVDLKSLGRVLGKFQYTWSLFDERRSASVVVTGGGVARVEFDVSQDRLPPGQQGAVVAGRVLVDGQPAAGYRLRDDSGWNVEYFGETEADGTFRIDRLAAQQLTLRISSKGGDGGYRGLSWRRVVDVPHDTEIRADFTLRTGRLFGRVTTWNGVPASGYFVQALSPEDATGDKFVAATRTDEHGAFDLRVGEGPLVLISSGVGGSARIELDGVSGGNELQHDVSLGSAGMVTGHVLVPDGIDVKYVTVRRDDGSWTSSFVLGDNGAFALSDQEPGTYSVTLQDGAFNEVACEPAELVVPADGLMDITIRPQSR